MTDVTDKIFALAEAAAIEARCCIRCQKHPGQLVTSEEPDASYEELADRQLLAWEFLVRRACKEIHPDVDPDRHLQPALIYALQSVSEECPDCVADELAKGPSDDT